MVGAKREHRFAESGRKRATTCKTFIRNTFLPSCRRLFIGVQHFFSAEDKHRICAPAPPMNMRKRRYTIKKEDPQGLPFLFQIGNDHFFSFVSVGSAGASVSEWLTVPLVWVCMFSIRFSIFIVALIAASVWSASNPLVLNVSPRYSHVM